MHEMPCTNHGCFRPTRLATIFLIAAGLTLPTQADGPVYIPNPTPALGDQFGSAIAAVGTGRIIVGAPLDDTVAVDAGIAYLFDMQGNRLRTYTSPNPRAGEGFGAWVSSVGFDRVLISAIQDSEETQPTLAGVSYLFDLSGNLLETFVSPNTSVGDAFGISASLGAGVLVMGAPFDDSVALNAGRVYQYQIGGNGLPTQTFTDPTPASGDAFGFPVEAVGPHRFVGGAEGANGGASELHIFDITTGSLVSTLQHPDQTFRLVCSAAALGTNKVLIGSENAWVNGIEQAGAVFRFDVETGTLEHTILNPEPEQGDAFGISVGTIGTNFIVTAADLDDPGGINNAGTVYLYDGAGNLLGRIDNPSPGAQDLFGTEATTNGIDKIIVGAPQGEDEQATGPGEVWIFDAPVTSAPALLTDVTRTLGLFLSGGLPELLASDDTYYVLQSGPGFNPAEPHPARADFGFDTGGFGASTLDVTLEEKANIGGPTSIVLLRNFTTSQWDEIGRNGLGPLDQTFIFPGIPAVNYIDGSNRLVVRVRTFAVLILNPTVRGIFSHDLVGVQLRQ